MIKFLGCRQLAINELRSAEVNFVKITPEFQEKEYINHHILLADVSGSMSGNIKMLKDRIRITLEALLQMPNSYVSIISYSGHNESKRILSAVKCDDMSYRMAKVYDVVESELYIKSVTVMSEPLHDAVAICKSLVGICDKHHIALFTDGCLVPWNWSEAKEREKCFEVAEICRKEGIFLNAIGFGMYYDRRFLKELIEIAANGSVIHIDEVKDYSEVILKTIKRVNEEKLVLTSVSTSDTNAKILSLNNSVLNNNITLVGNGGILALIDGKNIKVDDVSWNASQTSNIDDDIVDDFYYALARNYLIEEDVDNYEFVLGLLGDTALFEDTQNCYSFIEKGNAVNKITSVLEDKTLRFAKGRNPINTSIEFEKLCVLEILNDIMQDKESVLYWDLNTPYHRITQKTNQIEDSIKFNRQESGLVPVTSLDVGSDKLNIGVKVSIPGKVIDSVSGLTQDACVFRNFTLINGGNVNVPYINAKLSNELKEKFESEGIIELNKSFSFSGGTEVYKINFVGVKSSNKRLLKSMNMSELIEQLRDIADLKCRQWAVNQLIGEVVGDKSKVEFSGDLSVEQIEIRKLLRIDENGIYHPESLEKDNTSPFEIYPAIHMSWDIKYPDKKMKEQYLQDYKNIVGNIKEGDIDTYNKLKTLIGEIRTNIRSKEFKVNCVRIASAIMNKSPFIWDVSLEKDKTTNDKILNRNMVVGGKVTANKKVVGEDIVEQKKWIQLIKCN